MGDAKRPRVPFVDDVVGAIEEEISEGYGRLSLVLKERHTNPHGVAHGGVATTLMDSAAAIALVGLRGQEERRRRPQATVEMNASLIAPAYPGDELVAEARVLSLRRSVAFVEAEIHRRSDNELIAKGRFTFAIKNQN